MSLPKDYGVILFDGVCNLCNHAVDFVFKRGRHIGLSLQR
ncbi:hypothetical protein C943_01475 [Mariniradius saccharolyticus AK6]|uniref:DUF393 domain-containing protein n=1 Tax=Mariniradius saccharolyticus AK6 TaxID=1239962 RepID=M7XC65_9BACT|nr:DCC1-like thiol-disulfide oxidoreductase family protein [Mariniradius saccharolyticus]EMS32213.1 hypothetical protein C943_01475 [Mariniradius saccharolyticus AK6]